MSSNKQVKISMKLEVSPRLYETILSNTGQKHRTVILTNIALVILPDGRLYLARENELGEPISPLSQNPQAASA